MDPIIASLIATLTSPVVGGVAVTVSGLALADFVTGVAFAFRNGTFEPVYVSRFVQSHVLGSLLPIISLIVLSAFIEPLVIVTGAAVAAYTVSTLASIRENLSLPAEA